MASSKLSVRHILITGIPGVGKTTIIKKIHQELSKKEIQCKGFMTEEVRVSGRRIGFDVITTNNERGQLARVSNPADDLPGNRQRAYKVGQYSVNMQSFELTALPTLQLTPAKEQCDGRRLIFLVDEVGKMELFSQAFIQAIKKLMSHASVLLVATIPVPKGKPIQLVEELRNGPFSKVFEVTHENRDRVLTDVLDAIGSSLKL
ncbi:unnamed protein product [Lymnaea stagnalis]|uniref:AAA+ ATPase domain-containing protein n=1 Tax=Lymnaea stagnalis TaxID=6523 RepID=A0AAV2I7N7_LYMST